MIRQIDRQTDRLISVKLPDYLTDEVTGWLVVASWLT